MTKEEIIAIVKECAAALEHTPSAAELLAKTKVSQRLVRKHFGTYRRLLAESGLEQADSANALTLREIFLDWARITRSLDRIPGADDYVQNSKYDPRLLIDRFRCSWLDVPDVMLEYARKEGLEDKWKDVLDIIERHLYGTAGWLKRLKTTAVTSTGSTSQSKAPEKRPAYGRPLSQAALSYAPTNEAGVVLLFGSMARELGFVVMRAQQEFPDCEAMRRVQLNRWERVRIEFEYESYSFVKHKHAETGCDLIVCWIHNWPDCPVEVLELQGVVGSATISA